MIKMKNILSENMRRFGTKNLNEQNLADQASNCTLNSVSLALKSGEKSIPGFTYVGRESDGTGVGEILQGTGLDHTKVKREYKLKMSEDKTWILYLLEEEDTAGNKIYKKLVDYWSGTWKCTDPNSTAGPAGGIILYNKNGQNFTFYLKEKLRLGN